MQITVAITSVRWHCSAKNKKLFNPTTLEFQKNVNIDEKQAFYLYYFDIDRQQHPDNIQSQLPVVNWWCNRGCNKNETQSLISIFFFKDKLNHRFA